MEFNCAFAMSDATRPGCGVDVSQKRPGTFGGGRDSWFAISILFEMHGVATTHLDGRNMPVDFHRLSHFHHPGIRANCLDQSQA